MKYQNLSLEKVANKYQQDFSALEGVFVFPVGEVCDKLGLNVEFVKLDKGKSGYFDSAKKIIFVNDDYSLPTITIPPMFSLTISSVCAKVNS